MGDKLDDTRRVDQIRCEGIKLVVMAGDKGGYVAGYEFVQDVNPEPDDGASKTDTIPIWVIILVLVFVFAVLLVIGFIFVRARASKKIQQK